MTQVKPITDNENYNIILSHEKSTAWKITSKVLHKPKLSIFIFFVPIVFIPYMQRVEQYKEKSRIFNEEYLYTKKIALDHGYSVYKQEISMEQAIAKITEDFNNKPNADNPLVANILEKQLNEIKLLLVHYVSLLSAKGENYKELVVSHYKNHADYLGFINKLCDLEKEVNKASAATFKSDAEEVPEIIEKMEKYLLEHRLEEAEEFFK